MATISAVAATPADHQAAWTRLQALRRQLATDLMPVQASPQTIASDKAAVAAAEAQTARIGAAKSVEDTQTVSSAAVLAAAKSVERTPPKPATTDERPAVANGRIFDITV